jgi:DNA polymerase III delta prime subunit
MKLELSSELVLTDFHYLIVGQSGTGKTLFLMLLIAKIAKELKQKAKENAHHHLYIIDPKGTSLYSLRHSFREKGKRQFARTPDEVRQLLQNFYNIIEERAKLFDNSKFSFDADYQTLELTPCYLIFDEYVDLMAKSTKKIKDEISQLLVQCITMGRQLGCFIILTMIRPDTLYLPGIIRSTMMKIYLATQGKEVDEQGAIMIFNTFKRLPKPTHGTQFYGYAQGEGGVPKLFLTPKLSNQFNIRKFLSDCFNDTS